MPKAKLAQVLPGARKVPRLKMPEEIADHLTEIAAGALKGDQDADDDELEAFSVSMAPVRAKTAAERYVSEKAYELPLPKFRKLLSGKDKKSLQSAVEALREKNRELYPHLRKPLSALMRTHTGEPG